MSFKLDVPLYINHILKIFFSFITEKVMFLKQVKNINSRSFVYFYKNDNCTQALHFFLTNINTSQTCFSEQFDIFFEVFRH